MAGLYSYGAIEDPDTIFKTGVYIIKDISYSLLFVFRAERTVAQIKITNNPKSYMIRCMPDLNYPLYLGGWGQWHDL